MNKMIKSALILVAGFALTTSTKAGIFDWKNTLKLEIKNNTTQELTIYDENSPDSNIEDKAITLKTKENYIKPIDWKGEDLYSIVPGLIKITKSDASQSTDICTIRLISDDPDSNKTIPFTKSKSTNICEVRLIVGMDKTEVQKPAYKKSGMLEITLPDRQKFYYANREKSYTNMYLRDDRFKHVEIQSKIDLNKKVYITISEKTKNIIDVSISN